MDIISSILLFCIGFIVGYLIDTEDSDKKDNNKNNNHSDYDYNALCDGEG